MTILDVRSVFFMNLEIFFFFAWLEERYQNNNGKEYDLYNKNMKD